MNKKKPNVIVPTRDGQRAFELTPLFMRECPTARHYDFRPDVRRSDIRLEYRRWGHTIYRSEVRRVLTRKPTPEFFRGASCGRGRRWLDWSFRFSKNGGVRFGCMRFSLANTRKIRRWARSL